MTRHDRTKDSPIGESCTETSSVPPSAGTATNEDSRAAEQAGSGDHGGIAVEAPEPSPEKAGTPDAKPDEVVLTFPTDGKGGREWSLMRTKLAEYEEAYPSLDVLQECRAALQWCRDHPTKRKTCSGMAGFLTRWLNTAQNENSKRSGNGRRTTGGKREFATGPGFRHDANAKPADFWGS